MAGWRVRRRMKRSIGILVILGVFLAACGGSAGLSPPATDTDGSRGSPGPAPDADGTLQVEPGTAGGPGISIDDALASTASEPLLVNGALYEDATGTLRLCSAIAESFPPQCGGTRLLVDGLDLSSIPGVEEANGVRWVEQVQLFGTVTPAGS